MTIFKLNVFYSFFILNSIYSLFNDETISMFFILKIKHIFIIILVPNVSKTLIIYDNILICISISKESPIEPKTLSNNTIPKGIPHITPINAKNKV